MAKFQKGISGNTAGRPKGIIDRRVRFREMVEPRAPEILEKAVTMALEGNEQMLRLILDRLLPARPKDDPVSIGVYAGNHLQQSDRVLTALYDGDISPVEANNLMSSIVGGLKVVEMDELDKRVAALEDRGVG